MITKTRNIRHSKNNIRNIIKMELKKLQYNFGYVGTKYLVDAIYLLYSLEKYYKFSLESDVYSVLANKYGDTASAIKGAIIYANDKMFYDCDENFLYDYLNDEDDIWDEEEFDSKPGPKKIIRAVLKRIKDL